MFQIFSIGVYILAEKHHLCDTVRHQAFNLADDVLGIAAELSPSYLWHDTVTAEIIASKHDVDP